MALYGVLLDKQSCVLEWLEQTVKRSEKTTHGTMFVSVKPKLFVRDKELLLLVSVVPCFPNYTFFGWLMAGGSWFILGWGWWVIPGLILGAFGVFWTAEVWYWLNRLALKKAGYVGKFRRAGLERVIEEVVF